MNHPMEQYHDLMRRCITEGEPVKNERTKEICYTLVGEQLKFDMRDGFPAVTTKKLAWKTMLGELLGILHGFTSAAEFRAFGCKVWDANANETPSWVTNPARKGTDDLGRSYGSQWTDWTDMKIVRRDQIIEMESRGYAMVSNMRDGNILFRRGINQAEEALKAILTNPTDRRIVINGWRPDEHDQTALPVCHMVYTFVPNTRTKRLDLVMHQRSWDTFLAFNIPMCAAFLHIMARLSGYAPGVVTMQIANAHVYESHVDQVKVQLTREHYPQPRLAIGGNITPIAPSQVKGIFRAIHPSDFYLEGYRHHEPLFAPMAA